MFDSLIYFFLLDLPVGIKMVLITGRADWKILGYGYMLYAGCVAPIKAQGYEFLCRQCKTSVRFYDD